VKGITRTNKVPIATLFMLMGFIAGWLISSYHSNAEKKQLPQEVEKPLYWVAPMDANYKRDQAGKSPMGMDLVPVYAQEANASADGITISPTVMNNMGVKIAKVRYQNLSQHIQTLGMIKENDNNIAHIHAYETAWVKKVYIKEVGAEIKQGQLVASIYSPKLLEAEQELVLALSAKPHATINTESPHQGKSNYIGFAKMKLKALGVSDQQIARIIKNKKADTLIDIYAPISGHLTTLNAREGMYITPVTNLMTLVNLNTVWVSVDVIPKHARLIALGDVLSGSVDGLKNEVFSGKISFIAPSIDPITRTLSVRATLDNPQNKLKPNLFINVSIATKPLEHVLTIPTAAVIRLKTLDYVILSLENHRFVAQEVKLGIEAEDHYQVLAGLSDQDNVVISAQFLIDSESKVQESLRRLTQYNAGETSTFKQHKDNMKAHQHH
jgi:Cu(I)/Ag(I) efflux system membrane fusion protein